MANDPLSFLFRRPSRPEVPANGAARPAAPAPNDAKAPAPSPAARTQSSDSFQAATANPAAAKTVAAPPPPGPVNSGHHVGGGNWLEDIAVDLFGTSRHRSPKDRTNLSQYAADAWGKPIPVSSNDDDPFAKESNIEGMHRTDFDVDSKGRPTGLHGNRAAIQEEDQIFRRLPNGQYVPFAWNPWPKDIKPNADGQFVFNEPRFPPHNPTRGPDGKVVVKDGLQVWTPNQLSIGSATAFEGMNSASRAAESWAGREIDWGRNGQLQAEPHAFIDFNAFYSPSARQMFFGVVPYRTPGDPTVKMFETASSYDMVAHESGHAIQHALMPNVDPTDTGFNTWGESFADQTAMWSSLKDRDRAQALLTEINGDPGKSNSLTRIGEAFAVLVGGGNSIRDAYQDLKVSNTSPEVHDRSQVLTGASYKIFQSVYQDQIAKGRSQLDALQVAGDVMGTLNTRATEHVPHDSLSLEDVGKAWLKVDKEYFKGKYSSVISEELKRREIFDDGSVNEFKAHEAALPKLNLWGQKNDDAVNSLVKNNLTKLGIGSGYDLQVTNHELDDNGAQIVHVRLRQLPGKGKAPIELDNDGILTFRPDGSLMDYQSPLPPGATTKDLGPILDAGRAAGVDQHGVPMGVRRKEDGSLTAVAFFMKPGDVGAGNLGETKVDTWSLDNPDGETTKLEHQHDEKMLQGLLPEGAHILTAEELDNLDPVSIAAGEQPPSGPVAEKTASPFVAPDPQAAPEPQAAPVPPPADEAKVVTAPPAQDGRQVPPAEG